MKTYLTPTFLLPLILLPFFSGINYLILEMRSPDQVQEEAPTLGINTTLPEPAGSQEVAGKFESVHKAYKLEKDHTVMGDLESMAKLETKENNPTKTSSRYVDSLKALFSYQGSSRYSPPKEMGRASPSSPRQETLRKLPSPDTVTIALSESLLEEVPEPTPAPDIFHSNTSPESFHGLQSQPCFPYVSAVLPTEMTVAGGERIPIQLLESLSLAGMELPAGTLLYGTVSRFSAERIHIEVSSVSFEGILYSLTFQVADMDGQPGLYVPQAGFVELSREVASDASSTQMPALKGADPGTLAEWVFNLADRGVQTSSRALARAARKNRATLRAGTLIYLIRL
jgi:conjugative transposon TraM protein